MIPPPLLPKKRMSNAAKAVLVVIIAVVVVAGIYVLVLLGSPHPVGQPNVSVTNTAAQSLNCNEVAGTYTLTFTFTLVNSGNRAAYATVSFYFNSNLVMIKQYHAPADSTQPETELVSQNGACPGSGSTGSIQVLNVAPA